jgi:hypothetical protein
MVQDILALLANRTLSLKKNADQPMADLRFSYYLASLNPIRCVIVRFGGALEVYQRNDQQN